MSKPFDIYDYVHNNKMTLKVDGPKGTSVAKAYNDIRKTNLNEVKIVNGKFSLAENLEDRKLSNEVKKHFLEIISTYNTFQDQMKRQSDMTEVANTLGAIVEAAKEMTLRESGDWIMQNFNVKPGPMLGKIKQYWTQKYGDNLDNVPEDELRKDTDTYIKSL